MRLTQAEIAHSIALKQSASAVVAQTTVENALNASRSRGAMLLGLVGGPIGKSQSAWLHYCWLHVP
jgi:hypothetical protein